MPVLVAHCGPARAASMRPCTQKSSRAVITPIAGILSPSFRGNEHRRRRRSAPVAAANPETKPDATPITTTAPPSPDPSSAPPTIWRWEDSWDAVKTYAVFLSVLVAGKALGGVPTAGGIADLPYFISLAVCTIYIGAHRGLNSRQRQQITLREGVLAPIFASAALFGLYLLVKFFPELSLQGFFDAYFWLLAVLATIGAFAGPGRVVCEHLKLPSLSVSLPSWLGAVDEATGEPITSADVAPSDPVVLALGIALASADLAAHHADFTLNNAIACLVAADILQLVGVSSFRVAAVLLGGLLAYDVFWVFGSPAAIGENVMLQVATTDVLVGPTRLIFPRVAGSVGEASSFPFALLGLGDVAVPGLLACLALRYDASRCVDMRARGIAAAEAIAEAIASLDPSATGDEIATATGDAAHAAYDRIADMENEQRDRTLGKSTSGSTDTVYLASDSVLYQRTYFVPVMVAYVAGLAAAFAANGITGMGQPALLYVVPAVLGAVLMVAASRGEVGRVLTYTDTTKSSGSESKKSERE